MKRLDIELYKRGLCETRNKAQEFIKKGLVKVNDKVENKSSFLINDEDKLRIEYPAKMYVSRGGEKLEKALQEFNISVQDRVVIDVGSSTGGFCDCLLQNGASKVLCVDVGSSQLHAKLRNDNRVISFENTDIRDFYAMEYNATLLVADVSFISLTKIIPSIAKFQTVLDFILLIKPQFECGVEVASKSKGIIKNFRVHKQIIKNICDCLNENNLEVVDLTFSPITGGDGNTEYLIHAKRKGNKFTFNVKKIEEIVKQAEKER